MKTLKEALEEYSRISGEPIDYGHSLHEATDKVVRYYGEVIVPNSSAIVDGEDDDFKIVRCYSKCRCCRSNSRLNIIFFSLDSQGKVESAGRFCADTPYSLTLFTENDRLKEIMGMEASFDLTKKIADWVSSQP